MARSKMHKGNTTRAALEGCQVLKLGMLGYAHARGMTGGTEDWSSHLFGHVGFAVVAVRMFEGA